MEQRLDVLLVQSDRGAADDAVSALEAAGHRVHRCFDEDAGSFPCRGVTDAQGCPLDAPIDVVLSVRRPLHPWPTGIEGGLVCGIRSGLPVIEQSADDEGPFTPWVTRHIAPDDDVVGACVEAAAAVEAELATDVRRRIARVLLAAEVDPAAATCWTQRGPRGLDVHVGVPGAVSRGVEEAIAVRALDALRSSGHTYGRVDVHVHDSTAS